MWRPDKWYLGNLCDVSFKWLKVENVEGLIPSCCLSLGTLSMCLCAYTYTTYTHLYLYLYLYHLYFKDMCDMQDRECKVVRESGREG